MDATNFIYWLQGFLEIADPAMLDDEQITIIKNHIKLVLTKVTPEFDTKKSLRISDMSKLGDLECTKFPNIMKLSVDGKIC